MTFDMQFAWKLSRGQLQLIRTAVANDGNGVFPREYSYCVIHFSFIVTNEALLFNKAKRKANEETDEYF